MDKKTFSNITCGLARYYRKAAAMDDAAKQVGWRDLAAQKRRFSAVAQLFPMEKPFSVNDLGCGQGDLLSFLMDRGYKAVDYVGYDVIEDMIRLAKEKHGLVGREFTLVKSASEMRRADFSVASGIFSLRMDVVDEEWLAYITDILAQMDAKSVEGFAFNCLTKYSDAEYMKPELYYADPLFMFDHCKKSFSRNVALLHDYEEFDFTIIVRK